MLNSVLFTDNLLSADAESWENDTIICGSMQFIRENYTSSITLEDVAKYVSVSRVYFCSYFKKVTGQNFIYVLNRYRVEKAKHLLATQNLKISSVAEEVGYKSVPYFYKIFTEITSLTPSAYRKYIHVNM